MHILSFTLTATLLMSACVGLRAEEPIFSAEERAAIEAVIAQAVASGLPDATGATLVWQDIKIEIPYTGNNAPRTLVGPHLSLPDGLWLVHGAWPLSARVVFKGLSSRPFLTRDDWLREHSTVMELDGSTTPGLIHGLRRSLTPEELERRAGWMQAIANHNLPSDYDFDLLGVTIAHLWQAGDPAAEILLLVVMANMALVEYDPWFSLAPDRLALGRDQAPRSPYRPVFGFSPVLSAGFPDPDQALRHLLVRSFRAGATRGLQLVDPVVSKNVPVFDQWPSSDRCLDAVAGLLIETEVLAQHRLNRLRQASLLISDPHQHASVAHRLQHWQTTWPESAHPSKTSGFRMGPPVWAERLPPEPGMNTRAGDRPPFTLDDASILIDCVADTGPCRWVDGVVPRNLGENALRSLTGLLGADPRLLVGIDPAAPWTPELQAETAQRLAQWWRENQGPELARRARDLLVPRIGRLDLVWMIFDHPGVDRLAIYDALARAGQAGPPAHWTNPSHWSGNSHAHQAFAHILFYAEDHVDFTQAVSAWPIQGPMGDSLLCWRLRRGRHTEVAAIVDPLVTQGFDRRGAPLSISLLHALASTKALMDVRSRLPALMAADTMSREVFGLLRHRMESLNLHRVLLGEHRTALEQRLALIHRWLLRDLMNRTEAAPPWLIQLVQSETSDAAQETLTVGEVAAMTLARRWVADKWDRSNPWPLPIESLPWMPTISQSPQERQQAIEALIALVDARMATDLQELGLNQTTP